jgi:hypothetical protein
VQAKAQAEEERNILKAAQGMFSQPEAVLMKVTAFGFKGFF